MTRSSQGDILSLDRNINRTLRLLKKAQRSERELNAEPRSSSLQFGREEEEIMAEHAERTLKELANQGIGHQSLCIQVPANDGATNFELKAGLIQSLPKFHGLSGEDLHKHLMEFIIVCATMKPPNVAEDAVRMRAFPFSLANAAKMWLFSQPKPITGWDELKLKFLEKFFPASRTASIRKEISGIRQSQGEGLSEYWERFNKLCATCPNHQISEQLLLQYFYEGLTYVDRNMLDAASGGVFMDKTPAAARNLISNMAENSQQFSMRSNIGRGVHNVEVNAVVGQGTSTDFGGSIGGKIAELVTLIKQMALGQTVENSMKHCGLCAAGDHFTDQCPQLQEVANLEHQMVAGLWHDQPPLQNQWQQQQFHNNPRWLPNPGYSPQGNNQQQMQQGSRFNSNTQFLRSNQGQNTYRPNSYQQTQAPRIDHSLEATVHDLKTQVGQLAATINELIQQKSGTIPAQPVVNPKSGET